MRRHVLRRQERFRVGAVEHRHGGEESSGGAIVGNDGDTAWGAGDGPTGAWVEDVAQPSAIHNAEASRVAARPRHW